MTKGKGSAIIVRKGTENARRGTIPVDSLKKELTQRFNTLLPIFFAFDGVATGSYRRAGTVNDAVDKKGGDAYRRGLSINH